MAVGALNYVLVNSERPTISEKENYTIPREERSVKNDITIRNDSNDEGAAQN